MTIREKMADWISGGALTDELNARISTEKHLKRSQDLLYTEVSENEDLRAPLRQIASLETPKANATVRKMARIAREALGE